MKRLKPIFMAFIFTSLIVLIGGCTMKEETSQNYTTKEETEKAALAFLEKEYQQKFTLTGEGTLESAKNIQYFKTKFKDSDGLEAEITLPQDKKSDLGDVVDSGVAGTSDTYSQVVYTKKARDTVEPLFRDEPFKKYFITLEGADYAKNDLSLSANEYFNHYQAEYSFFVILKDDQSTDYYAEIIDPFYQKLITKQANNFGLFIYANKKEIFSINYVNSKGFNPQKSYEEILEDVQVGMSGNQPQPEEKWLRSEYYNGDD